MRPDLRLCPGTVAATSIDLVDNIGNQTIVVGIDGSATKGRPDHAGTHGTAHQAALAAR